MRSAGRWKKWRRRWAPTSLDDRALDVFLQAAQVLAHGRARPLGVARAQGPDDLAVLVVVLALAMQRAVQAEQPGIDAQLLHQPRKHHVAAGGRDQLVEAIVEMPVVGFV